MESPKSKGHRSVVLIVEPGSQANEKKVKVFEQINCLVKLAHLITSAVGNIVSWFIVSVVFYYAVDLNKVFKHFIESPKRSGFESSVAVFGLLFFLLRTSVFFYFSAEGCYQVIAKPKAIKF